MSESTRSDARCLLRKPPDSPERWLPRVHRCPVFRKKANPQVTQPATDCVNGHAPWPLVFLGEPGAGKTCAALCMLDFFGRWYWIIDEWFRDVTDARLGKLQWSSGARKTEKDVWGGIEYHQHREPKLVVFDELGARRATDVQRGILSLAVDKRYGMPTIYITNLGLEELAKVYDDRIASRLSVGTVIGFKGDLRLSGERCDCAACLAALETEPGGGDG